MSSRNAPRAFAGDMMATSFARATTAVQRRSFDGDVGRCGFDIALVIGPFELELSAFGRRCKEADEGVRGNRWVHVGPEDLLAIIGAHERVDDVARHHGAD